MLSDSYGKRVLFDASIPLAPGEEKKAEFVF